METFAASNFNPVGGVLYGPSFDASLMIKLEPFEVENFDGEMETVVTDIRLDCIHLPTLAAEKLACTIHEFPTNPDDGYIDGSIYMRDVHVPVDVTRIRFGDLEDGSLMTLIVANFLFEFEGTGFADMASELSFPTRIDTPIQDEHIKLFKRIQRRLGR